MLHDDRLRRLDACRSALENPQAIPATLFAGEGVPIERGALDELFGVFALQQGLLAQREADPSRFGACENPGIERAALTPDFHKGSGIPILALMVLAALRETCGEPDARLVYDAPHNLVWKEEDAAGTRYIHRKGACPARGMDAMAGTPFAFTGEPVLVPGSMGASSFVLAGNGLDESLRSASHGAGRQLSRGDALKADDALFAEFLRNFRVVTPVDFRSPAMQQRRDILAKKLEDLKKEAPFAYKGIGPVVETLTRAGIARPVAELRPIMTVKG